MSDKFVTVATFDQAVEAHLARSKLESEGIACFVSEGSFIQVNWLLASAFGGVKLKVPATEADRARNALRPRPRLVVVADAKILTPQGDELICPRCRSFDVYDHHLSRRVEAVAVVLFSFLGRSRKRRLICKQCGHVWKSVLGAGDARLEH